MRQLQSFGINKSEDSKRQLFVLELAHLSNFPRVLNLPSPHFKLLLVSDAHQNTADEIALLAHLLIEQGLVYICSWGADCERVNDIFDEVDRWCQSA